jgi:hypothetical protein
MEMQKMTVSVYKPVCINLIEDTTKKGEGGKWLLVISHFMTDTQYLARRYGRSNARKDLRTQK